MLYYKVLNLISNRLFLFHSAFFDIKFYEADLNLWKYREKVSKLFIQYFKSFKIKQVSIWENKKYI